MVKRLLALAILDVEGLIPTLHQCLRDENHISSLISIVATFTSIVVLVIATVTNKIIKLVSWSFSCFWYTYLMFYCSISPLSFYLFTYLVGRWRYVLLSFLLDLIILNILWNLSGFTDWFRSQHLKTWVVVVATSGLKPASPSNSHRYKIRSCHLSMFINYLTQDCTSRKDFRKSELAWLKRCDYNDNIIYYLYLRNTHLLCYVNPRRYMYENKRWHLFPFPSFRLIRSILNNVLYTNVIVVRW